MSEQNPASQTKTDTKAEKKRPQFETKDKRFYHIVTEMSEQLIPYSELKDNQIIELMKSGNGKPSIKIVDEAEAQSIKELIASRQKPQHVHTSNGHLVYWGIWTRGDNGAWLSFDNGVIFWTTSRAIADIQLKQFKDETGEQGIVKEF